jgi:hypothetical protein
MPAPRTTTAQTRSGLVARGRARTNTTTAQASAEGSGRGRGRGRAKGKKKAAEDGGSKPDRGKGRGSSKRKASTLDDAPIPETGTNLTRTYPTGHGSAHWWLFGDEVPETQETGIPDLNEALHDEIQISQNAPPM